MSDSNFLYDHPEIFESVTNYLYDAIVIYQIFEEKQVAVFANQSFYDLTGYDPDDVIGNAPVFFGQKDQQNGNYRIILNSIQTGAFLDKEILCLKKSGTPFWANLKSVRLDPNESNNIYQIIILKDITFKKKKEIDLEKALADAEYSKTIKERFLANMSHEMRTPINGIMGMAQLIDETELNSLQREYLEELKLSSENLLAIVNDILEFNFIESGALNLEVRKFNIRKQLSQLVDTLKEKAQEKKLSLDLVISEKMPDEVIGDVVRFSQILMNLISNSIKFTNQGGVTLFVRALDKKDDRIPIEIKIKDTGIGIPESMLYDIFNSFNQASKVTTYKYGGSGLGLSIVHQLVGLMDGTINVESKEGRGTLFTLVIPFETAETQQEMENAEEGKSSKSAEKSELDGINILVVDDYLINRRIVKGMLEKAGANVDQAETGEQALEMLSEKHYSIILMDVHMPGMGGLATTKRIRELEDQSKRDTTVIAITASVLQRDIEDCRDAGMDDFIAKPFTKKDLESTVVSFVKKNQTRTSTFQSLEDAKDGEEFRIDSLMEMTGGDKRMVREMIELFLQQTPDMLMDMRQTLNRKDFKELSRIAHTLKPTFTYMDMDKAFVLAESIEASGLADSPDESGLTKKFDELEGLCKKYEGKLLKTLKSLS
jgi:PAS domain S-box-containing protein